PMPPQMVPGGYYPYPPAMYPGMGYPPQPPPPLQAAWGATTAAEAAPRSHATQAAPTLPAIPLPNVTGPASAALRRTPIQVGGESSRSDLSDSRIDTPIRPPTASRQAVAVAPSGVAAREGPPLPHALRRPTTAASSGWE